jgi:hypothetical protein
MQQPHAVLRQLQAWVKENPNRKREVIPIEICVVSDTQEGEDAPATVAGGWIPTPLEPPGPLSLYLWKTDPEFRGGTPPVRPQLPKEHNRWTAAHYKENEDYQEARWEAFSKITQLYGW